MLLRVLICLLAAWAVSAADAPRPPSPVPPDPQGTARHSLGSRWPSWWKVGAELRGRLDTFTGLPGVEGGRDTYYLHRLRLNSAFHIRPWLRLFTQVQDSRVASYSRTPCPKTVANSLDLRQAYIEAGGGEQGWRLRAGRQTLVLGDMRLVSTSNWGNVGPGFDMARLSYRQPRFRLDAWGGWVVLCVSGFDRPRRDRRFYGFYSSLDNAERSRTLDTYFLWKSYPSSALQVYTYGLRSLGKLAGGFDYSVEMALQHGHAGQESVEAWAGHWEADHPLGEGPRAPRLAAEYNFATGDGKPGDGRRTTFDQLFPTNVYGTAGDFGWRNIHEPVLTLDWRPAPKWRAKTSYHHFWLADRRDALYAINGAVYAQNRGAAHSRAGGEIDFRVIYQLTPHLQIWCGYARLFAGPFLKEAGRDSVHYPYAMWTYSF